MEHASKALFFIIIIFFNGEYSDSRPLLETILQEILQQGGTVFLFALLLTLNTNNNKVTKQMMGCKE